MRYYDVSTPTYTARKDGERSVKINGKYISNNPYYRSQRRSSPVPTGSPTVNYLFYSGSPHLLSASNTTILNNRLYGKLREELIGPKGELLTSTVEWKSSLDMISKRALQLTTAYSAVRKLKFKKAARILQIPLPKRLKGGTAGGRKDKGAAPTELWLEYWMGWAPLAGDIGLAIDKLTGWPTESKHFSVGVRDSGTITTVLYETTLGWSKEYYERSMVTRSYTSRLSAYGDVVVTNHNYQLANQLGFTNPALTLWQIVPFSFIVDWFANVGTCLGSLTDFNGLSFTNTGTATMETVDASSHDIRSKKATPGDPTTYSRTHTQWGFREELRRKPGVLPVPIPNIVMLDKLSLTRAATSVSLLVEIFLRK